MIQERIDIAVAARPETVLEVLKDVESVDRWLRPHLPAWPPVTSNMTVVESFEDGSPRLVRTVSSTLGISDDSLTEYQWYPDGCQLTLLESKTLRHNVSRFTVIPDEPESRLTAEIAPLQPRAPGATLPACTTYCS
ncbi:oligoketide cyclase/lipid transport protein [Mycobacteroides abscessus subsp. abscessus]|nr:oligoketide cyclase/lipid transport protein [Mycobacteroides abscessus subsp. abscessus]